LQEFGRVYEGEMWLEVLLARGVNDSTEDIAALKSAVARIKPDRLQLNTVARPPMEDFARPLDLEQIETAAAELAGVVTHIDVLPTFSEGRIKRPPVENGTGREGAILAMLRRRPCPLNEISQALRFDEKETSQALHKLLEEGEIQETVHGDALFYQVADSSE